MILKSGSFVVDRGILDIGYRCPCKSSDTCVTDILCKPDQVKRKLRLSRDAKKVILTFSFLIGFIGTKRVKQKDIFCHRARFRDKQNAFLQLFSETLSMTPVTVITC